MNAIERRQWADKVIVALRKQCDLATDVLVILAGAIYRENLVRHLAHYEVPMEGLAFGKQLHGWIANCDDPPKMTRLIGDFQYLRTEISVLPPPAEGGSDEHERCCSMQVVASEPRRASSVLVSLRCSSITKQWDLFLL